MPNTYTLISTTKLSSNATTISFTSIPQTYDDLILQFATRSNQTDGNDAFDSTLRFNGSAANLNHISLRGDGSGVNYNGNITDRMLRVTVPSNYTASTFSNVKIHIPRYKLTSINKIFYAESVVENNATGAAAILISGIWSQTAAITQLDIVSSGAGSPNFVSGSIASLYGIKNS